MPEPEKIIAFRFNRAKAQIANLIAGKNQIIVNGELKPARISDVLRGILNVWIDEHAFEYFPQLLKDFKKQGIENEAVQYMKAFLANAKKLDEENQNVV